MGIGRKLKNWWREMKRAIKDWIDEQNRLADEAERAMDEPAPAPAVADAASEVTDNPPAVADTTPAVADAVDFPLLRWCWGGFNGGKAVPAGGARITSLDVRSDGLSYRWASGGCELLGAASSTDASCIAALFVSIDGTWRGGKFDWISTSRRTRDFKNILEGYQGWDKAAIGKADAYAFLIVSADGRKRTNVLMHGRA